MKPPGLPPVTDAHRHGAYELLRLHCTYEAAMQNDTTRRVIEACAAQQRTRIWNAQHGQPRLVRRYHPATGAWRTQTILPDAGELIDLETGTPS